MVTFRASGLFHGFTLMTTCLYFDDLARPLRRLSGAVRELASASSFFDESKDGLGSKVAGELAVWEGLAKITRDISSFS